MKLKKLLVGTIALAMTQISVASQSSGGIASDRASYNIETGKLHIPYLVVDETKSEFSSDLLFVGSDLDGKMLFTIDIDSDLHEIHAPHFAYDGDSGPSHWGELTTDYKLCSLGKSQSPIDLNGESIEHSVNDIEFHYTDSALNILNNGHTIQVNYDVGSNIVLNNKEYKLLQFHFHTPSEHTIDGVSFPMEMHLVHQSEDGALAVVGVMIEEGADNLAYSNIIDNIPATEAEVETIDSENVDVSSLLPISRKEYRYSGSLTTPPCSEGVQWLVLQDSIQMSTAQLAHFETVLHHNNRPIQSKNARNIIQNIN